MCRRILSKLQFCCTFQSHPSFLLLIYGLFTFEDFTPVLTEVSRAGGECTYR